ncbi:MAG TPA: META domain-containing protein, partial [Polyangiales bacterium]
GRYSMQGARITLSELAYTEAGCALPLIEDKVQAVLSDGELQFAIEARRLTLTRGSIGLHLDAL